jgi:DNA-binding LacI/PurR family transcriptional regulator
MAKRHSTDSRPTIAHIAQAAGVSVPTVSKVLNNRADVSPSTRSRVEQVIAEFGFVRNRAARALTTGHSGLIDLVLPRIEDDYFLAILQGVEQTLKVVGFRLVLTSTYYETEEEFRWIDKVTDRSTDGILLVLPSEEAIARLADAQIPIVIIHTQGSTLPPIPSVTITSWNGGYNATRYLIERGHQRIAYIGKSLHSMDALERFAGYRTAMEEAGLVLDPAYQCEGRFTASEGYAATLALLDLPNPPTAIFAGNDHQATGVYQALYERAIPIPQGVSVIGFDDLPYSSLMNPPLTTIHVPRQDLGKFAASMLLQLIKNEKLDVNHVILPTLLIERNSCAPLESSQR